MGAPFVEQNCLDLKTVVSKVSNHTLGDPHLSKLHDLNRDLLRENPAGGWQVGVVDQQRGLFVLAQPGLEGLVVIEPGLKEGLEVWVLCEALRHPASVGNRVFGDAVPPELNIARQELNKLLDTAPDAVDIRVLVEKLARDFIPQHEVEHGGGEGRRNSVYQSFVPPIEARVVEESIVWGIDLAKSIGNPTEGHLDIVALIDGRELCTDEGCDSRVRNQVVLEEGYEMEISRPLHQRPVELGEGQ